ncbi:peptidoglycan-binding protein [Calothrix sp. UHCC 0171]|uniref:peptidoglycan-binding protein n=1 Tax=Calothrix sp. UHCC 0171 TaxID=3110245 RepID=UPI002B218A61|nr:peptidoglycan-binding protein [Calothrix sp. UHCC 0171]MEA5570013.1 peptidoglycan-binding protein [Calothrix sp. UHCC 0171]
MWLCRPSSLIISFFVFLGLPSRANAVAYGYSTPASSKLVQVFLQINNSTESSNQTTDTTTPSAEITTPSNPIASPASQEKIILKPGNSGSKVKELQTQLKQLGFYNGEIDGGYGAGTRAAVTKFQSVNGLDADGIFKNTTQEKIEAAIQQKLAPTPSPTSTKSSKSAGERDIFWWVLIAIGILGTLGALAFLMREFGKSKSQKTGFQVINAEVITKTEANVITQYPAHEETVIQEFERFVPDAQVINEYPEHEKTVIQEFETIGNESDFHNPSFQDAHNSNSHNPNSHNPNTSTSELLPPEKTSRLAKVNIVDELVRDLRSADTTKRRKAIWDLGQQGDSRAIQPLVDLMMDADSQQRSLILAAVSEISVRTLKPMNRALAMSLQDESPEVRQNAIRDLTRVYDLMAQVSQMLVHASQDENPQVQATAKYALSQMNRIRTLSGQDTDNS